MPPGRNLSKRHRSRASAALIDSDALSRSLTAIDPEWRSRKRVGGPLHLEARAVLHEDKELRGERLGLR